MVKGERLRKRNRYVAQACDRCKAAKVRCDGGFPCGYCRARRPEGCHYYSARFPVHQKGYDYHPALVRDQGSDARHSSDNEPTSRAALSAELQRQADKLDLLLKRVSDIDSRQPVPNDAPSAKYPSTLGPRQKPLPLFESPTSSFFCISVVDTSLEAWNSAEPHRALTSPGAETSEPSTRDAADVLPRKGSSFHIVQGKIISGKIGQVVGCDAEDDSRASPADASDSSDILNELPGATIVHLLRSYHETVGFLYNIIDTEYLARKLEAHFSKASTDPASSARPNGWPEDKSDENPAAMDRSELSIVKMAIIIASIGLDSFADVSTRIYQSLRQDIDAIIWHNNTDIKGLTVLVLASLYHFHRGEWRLSWRLVGNIVRVIHELGLNCRVVFDRSVEKPQDRAVAVNTVWTAHVLNKHLSYTLGLSTAMQDTKLDTSFPGPVGAPYLRAMTEYAQIGASSCEFLVRDSHRESLSYSQWQESLAFAEFRLENWRQRIPREFQLPFEGDWVTDANQLLSRILYLRANHLQIIIYKSFLCADLRRVAPTEIWSMSVPIAADSIQILTELDPSSRGYILHHTQLYTFLIAALGCLLLAITQDVSIHTGPLSNDKSIPVPPDVLAMAQRSALTAMNILQGQAGLSKQSQTLWDSVRRLASRLNLFSSSNATPAQSSEASQGAMSDPSPHYSEQQPQPQDWPQRESRGTYNPMDMNMGNFNSLGTASMDLTGDLNTFFDTCFLATGGSWGPV